MKSLSSFSSKTIALLSFSGILPLAVAEAPLPNELEQIDVQQQQRQSQNQQALAEQLKPDADIRLEAQLDSVSQLPQQETPCFPLSLIQLVDYSPSQPKAKVSQFQWALTQAQQDLSLKLPYCLGNQGLSLLMKQIQNRIIERGFVTTRIVVEEQDLRSGRLVLTVIKGKIGRFLVMDRGDVPRFTRLNAFTAFPMKQGDLLNLRDIEQSLENLKRVPTVEANIEILPSEGANTTVGESDLKVSYQQHFPFRLHLGLDDSGSTSTGKWQGSATLSVDNLFSANDLFYASLTHSLKRHSDEKGKRASQNFSLYYSIPLGYWQLTATRNRSRYHQEVFGAFENYRYSGESQTDKLTLSYLLYRDSQHKSTLSGAFWARKSQNYINDAEIEVQKRRMAGWEISLSHKAYWRTMSLEANLNFKRGTGARGAISAPEELWNEGTSRPKIISASLSLTKPFSIGKQQWQLQSSWNGQWNKTPLIAQDRFSLGGRYTVRGFDGELSLAGERGWVWRNELALNLKNAGHWLYLGIDGGRVMGQPSDRLGQHLVGSVLGIRGSWKGFSYDYFVGRPVRQPEGFRTSRVTTGFNLSYSF